MTHDEAAAVPPPRGHVDGWDGELISGWAVRADGQPATATLHLDGRALDVAVRAVPRGDVVAALGLAPDVLPGFVMSLPDAAWDPTPQGSHLQVLFDGLPVAAPLPFDRAQLVIDGLLRLSGADDASLDQDATLALVQRGVLLRAAEPADWPDGSPAVAELERQLARHGLPPLADPHTPLALARARGTRVACEHASLLALEGWAWTPSPGPDVDVDDAAAPEAFALRVGTRTLPVSARRTARRDVAQALAVARERLGFIIQLPTEAWEACGPSSAIDVSLEVSGRRVAGTRWRISAQALLEAIEGLSGPGDGTRLTDFSYPQLAERRDRQAALMRHAEAAERAGVVALAWAERLARALHETEAELARRGLVPGPESSVVCVVEGADDFMIRGWACDTVVQGEVFTLTSAGRVVDAVVTRVHRADVQKAQETDRAFLGFQIPLPPRLWPADAAAHLDEAAAAFFEVSLSVNGRQVLAAQRFDLARLDHALVTAGAILAQAAAKPGVRSVFARSDWLHLIDHVEAAGGAQCLSAEAARALAAGTERLRLSDRLDAAQPTPEELARARVGDDHTPARRLGRQVEALQRSLNAALGQGLAPMAALESVLADPRATGAARAHLLQALVPFACGHGLFARILTELDVAAALHLTKGDDNWHLSLLLPFLCEAGRFAAAADALAAIAAHPGRGWINTECVEHAVEVALDPIAGVALPGSDPAPSAPAARGALLQAFQALVQALGGDPWSREADARLVATAARALDPGAPLDDPARHALHGAIFASYALQPAFWQALDAGPAGPAAPAFLPPWHDARVDVDQALGAATRIQRGVRLDDGELTEALQALARLRRLGARDADAWTRSLVLAGRPRAPAVAAACLADLDAADLYRLAPAALVNARAAEAAAAAATASATASPSTAATHLDAEPIAVPALAWQRAANAFAADAPTPALARPAEALRASVSGLPVCGGPPAPSTGDGAAALARLLRRVIPLCDAAVGCFGAALAQTLLDAAGQALDMSPGPGVLADAAAAVRQSLHQAARQDESAQADRHEPPLPGLLAAGLPPQEQAVVVGVDLAAARPGQGAAALDTLLARAHFALHAGAAPGVCLVAEGSRALARATADDLPRRHHFFGWPMRRQARVPAPGSVLAVVDRPMAVPALATGIGLSRWAVEALAREQEAARARGEPALDRLDAEGRLAELLARAGLRLAPTARLAEPLVPGVAAGAPALWPIHRAPRSDSPDGTNRLQPRSAPDRMAALAAARWIVVAVARNERVMLPHFLAHYRGLGATAFVIVDNQSDDGSAEYLLAQPDVALYTADTEYRLSHYGVAWQQAVLAAHGAGRWAVVADIDELLVWPGCEDGGLDPVLDALDRQDATAVQVMMVDMYPAAGLADARLESDVPFQVAPCHDQPPLLRWRLGSGYYSNGATWLSSLRHRLLPDAPPNAFTSQKVALMRHAPWVRLSEGLHFAAGLRPAARSMFFAHFKYHAGFLAKVEEEIERMQHYDDAAEYRQYLGMRDVARQGFAGRGTATWQGSRGWIPQDAQAHATPDFVVDAGDR